MKKQTLKALIKKLDTLNIKYNVILTNNENKLIISDENQPEDVYIADWNYDCVLNECLNDVVAWLDERGYNFECEWSGTFSLNLNY